MSVKKHQCCTIIILSATLCFNCQIVLVLIVIHCVLFPTLESDTTTPFEILWQPKAVTARVLEFYSFLSLQHNSFLLNLEVIHYRGKITLIHCWVCGQAFLVNFVIVCTSYFIFIFALLKTSEINEDE